VAVLQPTLAIDNSNCTSKQNSTNVAVSTTEAANEEETSLSTNNFNYKVCYDVELQKTIDGYMIFLGGNEHHTPYVLDYKVCFEYYKWHKGDVLSEAVKSGVMQNKPDALPSVNGQDVSGIVLDEVLDIISSYKTNPETCKKKLKLTFLDRDSFNANSSIKTAFKS
jgi:hypothetical protein